MHGISGPYATRIFRDVLGVSESNLMRCNVLEDFGGCHPDPNLTYAPELVKKMGIFE
jgi:phosphoglucomutase